MDSNLLVIDLFPWFNKGKKINAAAGNEDSMGLINLGTDTDLFRSNSFGAILNGFKHKYIIQLTEIQAETVIIDANLWELPEMNYAG